MKEAQCPHFGDIAQEVLAQLGRGRAGPALAAFALAAAGSLPLGFGISAVILELAGDVLVVHQVAQHGHLQARASELAFR